MRVRRRLGFVTTCLGAALALTLAVPMRSQSPIGPEVFLHERTDDFHNDPRLVALADGSWRAVWIERPDANHVPTPYPELVVSRSIGAHGELGPIQTLVEAVIPDSTLEHVTLLPLPVGFALFFYRLGDPILFCGRFFDLAGNLTSEFSRTDNGFVSIAPRSDGRFTDIALQHDHSLAWSLLDAQGGLNVPWRSISRGMQEPACYPLGFDATPAGDGLVAWAFGDGFDPRQRYDTGARFFTATGERGPLIQVNPRPGAAICPAAALLPGAREAWVVYRDGARRDPPISRLYGQRIGIDGRRLGPELKVAVGNDDSIVRPYHTMASDRFGNFVVAWTQFSFVPFICGATARVFRPDGRPVGPEFSLSANIDQCGQEPHLAIADNGILGAVWILPRDFGIDSFFTRFSISPADEPCLVRSGRLLCDTGRSGGAPEIDQAVTAEPGATVLLGDMDGDSRADPCVVAGGRLRCDLDHRGEPFELDRPFDPGDGVSLLGDVQGTGKAVACVWKRGELSCKTGAGTFQESFGTEGDVPLLGDLDGNGKADLCLWRNGSFLCDTKHDGGSPDLTISFGRAGDLPLLGDFDGDGRADPCVLRKGVLRCDTRHDGGKAEGVLALDVQAGDRALLANLDGV